MAHPAALDIVRPETDEAQSGAARVFTFFRDRLLSLGLQPGELKSLSHGDYVAARFFFITDPDGYKIEVLSREGHYV